MSFKPFYIHRYMTPGKLPNRAPRAFTLMIQPHASDQQKCIVSGTFCAPKDQFNKKLGRQYAAKAEQREINKRDVPHLLYAMAQACEFNTTPNEFFYVYKYML